jgi:hypothetical protein
MCTINPGDEVHLVKGGYVLLPNGELHKSKDCVWKGGVISLKIVTPRPKPIPKPSKKEGVTMITGGDVSIGEYTLEPITISYLRQEEPEPSPPLISDPAPLAIVGAVLIYALKKVAGLDRELKSGSCEIRHQQAVIRIAKLEGKVLRKQIVDGAKLVKEKVSREKED